MTYYIRHKDTYFKLNATQDISVTYPAKTTAHPTQDRKSRSDNYIMGNPTSSYSGVITDVQTASSHNKLPTGEYIDRLVKAMELREPLAYKYRLDKDEEDGWFITSLNASQSNSLGFGGVDLEGNIVQSFRVSFNLERVTFVDALDVSLTVDPKYSLDLQPKKESSGATQSFDEDDADGEKVKKKEGIFLAVEQTARLAEEARYYRGTGYPTGGN